MAEAKLPKLLSAENESCLRISIGIPTTIFLLLMNVSCIAPINAVTIASFIVMPCILQALYKAFISTLFMVEYDKAISVN